MNSFEFNKIAGAILGSILLLIVIINISGMVVSPAPIETRPYVIEGVTDVAQAESEEMTGDTAPAAEAASPETTEDAAAAVIAARLAAADPASGERQARVCGTCHTFEEGGPNRVGPNLWDIVGRPVAGHEGFSYSSAMSGMGGTWTFERLDAYLADPRSYVPGTNMVFVGVRDPGNRADLIAYLRQFSDTPAPLPATMSSDGTAADGP